MKNLLLAIILTMVLFTLPAMAQEKHVAIFKDITGSIEVLRGNETLQATSGMQLLQSDKIHSYEESSAGIVFNDGTLLTLGESTDIEINLYVFKPEVQKYAFDLNVNKGQAIYSSGKIGKLSPESVDIRTPRAVVGVRGTRFIVKVD
ncbi:MAG: FecR domain-containing protein [Mariprofundaceae bacterium]|nr:FecR domain-containing protein [Mariprofundaceae bacterium]